MTTQDAAKYLSLSSKTVERFARKGLLPGTKLGGEWRFLRVELRRHLEQWVGGQGRA